MHCHVHANALFIEFTEMIKESPELVAVTRRWLKAFQEKDHEVLTNLLSKSAHLRYIGTADNEFWGGSLFRDGFADHVDEIPNISLTPSVLEAYECGDAGWAFIISELQIEGIENTFVDRMSWVYVMEEGAWKVAHIHTSFPTPNIEVIGVEHSAFDELIESAMVDFDHAKGAETTTIMFTDIVNSTAIAQAVGDRVWYSTIVWHMDTLTGAIEENGGEVTKSTGDGTMSTFSSVRGALTGACAIQNLVKRSQREPEIRVRIGMHTGDVFQSKGDFFGNVVNKAARVASAAGPGQIFITDVVRAMVESSGEYCFKDPAMVILKGIDGLHSISTLEWN